MYISTATAIALSATLVTASDVFAVFRDSNGNQIGDGTNFDVSDTNCFAAAGAYIVGFSAGFTLPDQVFAGPYCLSAWADGACPGDPQAKQTFENVKPTDYILDGPLANVGSYKWSLEAC